MFNLETRLLFEHPDNPRKDLGDLTELTESIRENGILQNLTVVEKTGDDGEWDGDNFVVVIGHRRLAAAKLAGLNTVPCSIAHMDYKKQIETMLCENIQRSDLTVYEQAQGFQMMIDLGESVAGIVKETGFSESTVRRRLKLAELDSDLMKEKSAMQIPITDYMKLEQIEDIETRNKVLKHIGTNNFEWELKKAIETEKKHKCFDELVERLREWADEEIEGKNRAEFIRENNLFTYESFYAWQGYGHIKSELEKRIAEIEKNLLEGRKKYFSVDEYEYIAIILERACEAEDSTDSEEDEAESQKEKLRAENFGKLEKINDSEEDEAESQKEKLRAENFGKLEKINDSIGDLHDEFMECISESECEKKKDIIIEAILGQVTNEGGCYVDHYELGVMTGFKPPKGLQSWQDEYKEVRKKHFTEIMANSKYKLFAQAVYSMKSEVSMHNWDCKYTGGGKHPSRYEYVTRLGYVASDTEIGYMEGTLDEYIKKE